MLGIDWGRIAGKQGMHEEQESDPRSLWQTAPLSQQLSIASNVVSQTKFGEHEPQHGWVTSHDRGI